MSGWGRAPLVKPLPPISTILFCPLCFLLADRENYITDVLPHVSFEVVGMFGVVHMISSWDDLYMLQQWMDNQLVYLFACRKCDPVVMMYDII